MSTTCKLRMLALLLVAALAGAPAAAAAPAMVNYQGVLRDASEAPITASLDMIFHLYDAPAAGNEILVDRHLAGLTGDVEVAGGLFNVVLGGGTVEDGAATGTYAALADVFRDFAEVYLEVEIETSTGFETLAPRTRIVSAAYALSAAHATSAETAGSLGGVGPAQFLRSDASDAFTSGTLTFALGTTLAVQGELNANGSIRIDADGPDADQSLFFFEAGVPTAKALTWDDSETRFEFNDELAVLGPLRVGVTSFAPASYSHFGSLGTPSSGALGGINDVFVSGDVELDGVLYLDGQLRLDDDGPDRNQFLYFYNGGSPTGESLSWNETNERFELSGTLRSSGALLSDFDLKTGGDIYVNHDGPDSNKGIFFFEDGSALGELFFWADTADFFDVSDSLFVEGNLDASGAKLFIQNHPYRSDLSVAYVALEGDEAGTFTRGFGRLSGGEARVALGETFALVTNPELGLTAHLTPRGEWAELYVESLTTSEIVVRAAPGSPGDVVFDYIVFGLRIGYEDHRVLRPRQVDSGVPFAGHYERLYADHPELRSSSALWRYRGMSDAAGLPPRDTSGAAVALRLGIGEFDPEADTPAGAGEHGAVRGAVDVAATAHAPQASDDDSASSECRDAIARSSGAADADAGPRAARVASLWQRNADALPVGEPVETGDVVVVDPGEPERLRLGVRAADPTVVGVVLHAAPFVPGAEPGDGVRLAAVGFSGVARCKVDASYGVIASGDLLTTSPTPGHAMVAHAPLPGTVVGKALEPLDTGTGTIRVLVMPR